MLRHVAIGLVFLSLGSAAIAQVTEPDLIVSALSDAENWGTANGITAYSLGTVVTNAGTAPVAWSPATNAHPIIAQNLYRLRNGRFQHIGMSWVTNPGPLPPGACAGSGGLNPGCSLTSTAFANGDQSRLGPRLEVDAATGVFPYPASGVYPPPTGVVDRRLQVSTNDVNPGYFQNLGALYFVEAQLIHPGDAASGTNLNDAAYRPVTVTPGTHELVFSGATQPKAALYAWKAVDPEVQIITVDVPGDGRLLVGWRGTPMPNPNSSSHHYEFAVQNLSCSRGVASVSVEVLPYGISPGITFCSTVLPVFAPETAVYHSGELSGEAEWHRTVTPIGPNCSNCGTGPGPTPFSDAVIWSPISTTDPNPKVLRWGSLFNFEFDAYQLPGRIALQLAGPGAPTTVMVGPFAPPRHPFVKYTSYTTANANSDWVDISTTGFPGPMGDDNSFAVPIGFAFPFYSNAHTQAVISTNGYLTFPGQSGNVALNTSLPSTTTPNGVIAGYWDDLDCSEVFDIRYKTVNGKFVVCWNCTHAGDTQPLKFEVILEPNGNITTPFLLCPFSFSGVSATVGIEGPQGTEGILSAFNTAASVFGGQSYRYERNSISANLFPTGDLAGGFFKLTYVGVPGSHVVTFGTLSYGPTDLGVLGTLPFVLSGAMPVTDYYGIYSGFPNPTSITDANGVFEFNTWIQPGSLPPGMNIQFGGVSVPPNPAETYNGWFNIANATFATS